MLSFVDCNKHLCAKYCARAGEGKIKVPRLDVKTLEIYREGRGTRWACAQGPVGGRGASSIALSGGRRGLAKNSEEKQPFKGRTTAGFTWGNEVWRAGPRV